MAAVLEETVAYLPELCSETEGSNQVRVHHPIFLPLADFLWACIRIRSKRELNHLILFLIAGIDFK